MDCLVAPLQEKLEDWKKNVVNLDKEHAKGNNFNCDVFILSYVKIFTAKFAIV